MALHVFVFLLVFCLILGLARLWHLYWLHLVPSHSRAGAMHTTAQHLRNRHAPPLSSTHFGMRNVKQIAILSLPTEKGNTKYTSLPEMNVAIAVVGFFLPQVHQDSSKA